MRRGGEREREKERAPSNSSQCHNPEGQRCPQPPPPDPTDPWPRGQHREARHGPGLIEPGSFIYTVKVTSNFLRLSCSSAIKSWRGQEQPPRPPARRGDTSGSPSRDTHGPRRLCNCQRDLATTGHSFRRLCLYSSSHFYFVLFRVCFFFNLAILFFFFLEHRTHTRRKALLQS